MVEEEAAVEVVDSQVIELVGKHMTESLTKYPHLCRLAAWSRMSQEKRERETNRYTLNNKVRFI